MKKLTIPICMLAISVMLSGCPDWSMDKRYPLYIFNNSERGIGFYLALGGNNGTYYPDTILPKSNQNLISKKINPSSTYYCASGYPWDEVINDLTSDTMSIFIFHSDTLDKYSWDEVREGYKILQRYDLSLKDLQKLDWSVTYPPSPEMKDMKMFPPYKEP